jgi:hypothetical protein
MTLSYDGKIIHCDGCADEEAMEFYDDSFKSFVRLEIRGLRGGLVGVKHLCEFCYQARLVTDIFSPNKEFINRQIEIANRDLV